MAFVAASTVTDPDGATSTDTVQITVQDTTSPSLTVPADITAEAAGPAGAAVAFSVSATDLVDGVVMVVCKDQSGAIVVSGDTFPLGTTTVSCTVTDAAGNSAIKTFKITVRDTTAPTISGVPADIAVEATSAAGSIVSFATPTASDLVDGTVGVTCSPASGALFPLGATTVFCSAVDAAGNTASRTFKVTVAYSWSGVLQPLNADGSSIFKLGRPIPVKFRLTGAGAGITDAIARLYVAKVSDGVAGSEMEADSQSNATEGNLFRYDAEGGQYIFNLSTRGLTKGTYRLRIDLGDGVCRTVDVSLQ